MKLRHALPCRMTHERLQSKNALEDASAKINKYVTRQKSGVLRTRVETCSSIDVKQTQFRVTKVKVKKFMYINTFFSSTERKERERERKNADTCE